MYIYHCPIDKIKSEQDNIPEVNFHTPSVSRAFISLTSNMTKLLRSADFYIVRRACIEQIHTPIGAQLPLEDVNAIKSSKNIDALFDALAGSPYWSWIDVRLLEAMVEASNNKQADVILERYKKAVFAKKLKDVLPNAPSKEVKEMYYSKVVSKLKKDPDEVTVWDLLQFQKQLEKVIMDIRNGICILEHLEKGCIEIHWYIPTCCADGAYQSAVKNCNFFHTIGLQCLQIGYYPMIHDPLELRRSVAQPDTLVNCGKLNNCVCYLFNYVSFCSNSQRLH